MGYFQGMPFANSYQYLTPNGVIKKISERLHIGRNQFIYAIFCPVGTTLINQQIE